MSNEIKGALVAQNTMIGFLIGLHAQRQPEPEKFLEDFRAVCLKKVEIDTIHGSDQEAVKREAREFINSLFNALTIT